ncbi:MAG TPA: hypothetical protein DEA55_04485 [Rhodospirillaceae bacterium]|nr:hypothetical protein [Rhodospirillaceae bacterium]
MSNSNKDFFKSKARDLVKDSDLGPQRIMAGFLAATVLTGTLAFSFQDKILTPVSTPAPEPKSPVVLNLEYPFCSADQVSMKLEKDVVAWVKKSDLRQVFSKIGEIIKVSKSGYSDSVDALVGDKLKRIRSTSFPVMNGTTLLSQSSNTAELAARGAITGAFTRIGVGVELETYEAKVSLNSDDTEAVPNCADGPKVQI